VGRSKGCAPGAAVAWAERPRRVVAVVAAVVAATASDRAPERLRRTREVEPRSNLRRASLRNTGRSSCSADSNRDTAGTRRERTARARAALRRPLVQRVPGSHLRARCLRTLHRSGSLADFACRSDRTRSPRRAPRVARSRSSAQRDANGRHRNRAAVRAAVSVRRRVAPACAGDCRNPGRTSGWGGCPGRTYRTPRAQTNPAAPSPSRSVYQRESGSLTSSTNSRAITWANPKPR
jgi:hypothetical protein